MHSLDAGVVSTKCALELWIECFAQDRNRDVKASFFHCRLAPEGIHEEPLGDQMSFVLYQNEQRANRFSGMKIEGLAIKKQFPSNGVDLEWAKSKAHDQPPPLLQR